MLPLFYGTGVNWIFYFQVLYFLLLEFPLGHFKEIPLSLQPLSPDFSTIPYTC